VRLAVWTAAILGVVAATTTATAYAQTGTAAHRPTNANDPMGWSLTELKNYGSNKCLGTYGGSLEPGTQVVQFDCNGHPDQMWWVNPDWGNSYNPIQAYWASSEGQPQCLALAGGNAYVGAHLELYNCLTGHDDQLWKFTQHGSSYVIWNKKAPNLVIAIEGGWTYNLASVELFYWQAQPDQSWVIPD
jgi:hypothetical protein